MTGTCPAVVLLVALATSAVRTSEQANTCDVVPKDQYIKHGSDAEVVCHTACVPGGVFWTLNNTPVNESLSETVNSSHTVLTLRNVTQPDATLQCHSAHTRQILGGTYIRTYQKPNKISCTLYSEDPDQKGVPKLLTCQWEHRAAANLNVKYTVLYAPLIRLNEIDEICSSHVTTCTGPNKILASVKASVTVRAKTDFWQVESDPLTFDPYDILKMSRPPLEVKASTDQLQVTWEPSVSHRKRHCQVRYGKVVSDGTPELKTLNKTLEPRQNGSETLYEVESCTNYSISVRCATVSAPWSSWSQGRTVLTKLNKSRVKLRLWRTIAEPGENKTRKVHAMWTEIPSACQGTFTYAIKTIRHSADTAGVKHADVLCGSSACDVDVSRDAHRIKLKVWEKESLLAEDSVYVPATGESLPQVTDIHTSALGGVVRVRWTAPVQPVSGYIIDWTHNGNQFYWKESEHTNTTLPDLLDHKMYNITVTPLFDNKTGHGARALHICSRVRDPGNVTLTSVEANHKSVFVGWNTKSQAECSGAVAYYTVFYGTEKGPMLNVTVDGTRQNITLRDLSPDTQYSVYVEASARTGSAESSRRFFKTDRFDPRLPLALGVCGSIVIALVFSLGLFCAIQWKKFSEKPVPNPGLSSLQLWSSANTQKGTGSFRPFSNPSESPFDHVCTEESHRASTSPPPTSCNSNPAGEEYADPAAAVTPDAQREKSREPLSGSSGESTALLPSGNSPFNPYRSQSSAEIKQCKHFPATPLERTAAVTVYVTLDMFEQGQSR